MKERPILFSAPMVRAILDGKKTQTRRIVKTREPLDFIGGRGEEHDPAMWGWFFDGRDQHGYMVLGRGLDERHDHGRISIPCPYGVPGDRLWVKETHALVPWLSGAERRVPDQDHDAQGVRYRATWDKSNHARWRPSIHMPRWASRITLEVTEVRVERLHDIPEEDARAEGVEPFFTRFPEIGRDQRITTGELARDAEHRASFAVLWDEINGKRALWISNPWVWALTFRRVEVSP